MRDGRNETFCPSQRTYAVNYSETHTTESSLSAAQIHLVAFSGVRLTAPGRGAVATVRLTCANSAAASAIDEVFTAANGMLASSAPIDRVLFGSWRGEDVVVVRTDESEWEVHCHGGEAAVTRILNECSNDASAIAPSESPFDHVLLQTRTTKTAKLVLAQTNGVLKDALLKLSNADRVDSFREQLTELLGWKAVARHLTESWQVVIAGPPNVGKSSLLNAIAGYERSIVFDQPGTTRDAVRTELVLDGWPFCFIDTAGIRRGSDDPIETIGIAHARKILSTAELVLIAVDHSVGWTKDHDGILAELTPTIPWAVVCCKADLAAAGQPIPGSSEILRTSVEQSIGIRELIDWVTKKLIPEAPTLDIALPIGGSAELVESLLQRLEEGETLDDLQRAVTSWLAGSLGVAPG